MYTRVLHIYIGILSGAQFFVIRKDFAYTRNDKCWLFLHWDFFTYFLWSIKVQAVTIWSGHIDFVHQPTFPCWLLIWMLALPPPCLIIHMYICMDDALYSEKFAPIICVCSRSRTSVCSELYRVCMVWMDFVGQIYVYLIEGGLIQIFSRLPTLWSFTLVSSIC